MHRFGSSGDGFWDAPPPSPEETDRLFREWARTGDPGLRERLILCHRALVCAVAARLGQTRASQDDLVQAGIIGLIYAVDRYQPTLKVRFTTYALPLILSEIKRCLEAEPATERSA